MCPKRRLAICDLKAGSHGALNFSPPMKVSTALH